MGVHFLEVELLETVGTSLHLFLDIDELFLGFILWLNLKVSLEIITVSLFLFGESPREEGVVAIPSVRCPLGHSLLPSLMVVLVGELPVVKRVYSLEDTVHLVDGSFYLQHGLIVCLTHCYPLFYHTFLLPLLLMGLFHLMQLDTVDIGHVLDLL